MFVSHLLGGRVKNNQTINQLGFSQSYVVVVGQSYVCLQTLPSYLGFVNSGLSRVSKKRCSEIYARGNPLMLKKPGIKILMVEFLTAVLHGCNRKDVRILVS